MTAPARGVQRLDDGTVRMIRERVNLDEDVYSLAFQRCIYTAENFDHLMVAFSGGKDSTAALNVMLEALHSRPDLAEKHLPLRAVFSDEEAIPFQTEEYVRRTFAREDVAGEWYCLPVKHRNACSRREPHWYPWAPEKEELWCRPLPPEAITHLDGFPTDPEKRWSWPHTNGLLASPELGEVAVIMGIRAQESITRRRAVSRRPVDNYLIPYGDNAAGNITKCYPIYDWMTQDVWLAPQIKGWDYNHAYDVYEQAGIGHIWQRCSPAFGEEPLLGLWQWPVCFPEVWDKMVDRVPGVGAAVRYSRSELYGFGKRPPKPEGQPWPAHVHQFAERWGDPQRGQVSRRVADEIRRHYRITSDPILGFNAHPLSGLDWDFLAMIAMRGDLKERKQVAGQIAARDEHKRADPRYWQLYLDELRDIEKTPGRLQEEFGYPRPRHRVRVPDYALEAGVE